MKKITSLFLALSLVFALAASAGAAEVSAATNSDLVTGDGQSETTSQ